MKIASYETSLLAKKKGFNRPTTYYSWSDKKTIRNGYHSSSKSGLIRQKEWTEGDHYTICRPYLYEIVEWLREEHEIHVTVVYTDNSDRFYDHPGNDGYFFTVKTALESSIYDSACPDGKLIEDHDQALEAGVNKALELI